MTTKTDGFDDLDLREEPGTAMPTGNWTTTGTATSLLCTETCPTITTVDY